MDASRGSVEPSLEFQPAASSPGGTRPPRPLQAYEQLLARLVTLSQAVASATDLLTVYRGLREFALTSTKCNGLYVSLFDRSRGERVCAYAFNEGREEDVSALPPLPVTESPASRALVTGAIIVSDDFQAAMAGQPRVNLGLAADPRLPQSAISVPMSVLGRPIGVFEIQSVERAAYTEEDVTAMKMAANIAAIAVENVILLEGERAQRHAAEAAEKTYRVLFRNNPLPMWVFDRETLLFLAVNEAAVRHYGYSEREFLQLRVADIRPPEDVAAFVAGLGAERRRAYTKPSRHRKKDGTVIDVEVTSDEITFEGRRARLILANDVTDRKRLEGQFLRAQRMESIGTLAGGIAHDLNNLLAPITMAVDLLKTEVRSPDGTHLLDVIERSAKRSAGLVRQVLSFARGVEGQRVIVQIGSVINELGGIVENTFPKNIRMQTHVPADAWPILGDATQLQQVLVNLCVNARDAMPQGGLLQVRTRNAVVDEQYVTMNRAAAAGRYVAIEVEDSGTGIPKEIVDKIFDPFFTTKETGKGSGLGLATTLAIIRGHKGFIEVNSEPGKGSIFRVYLPAELAPDSLADESPADALARGHGELILVVDDEPSILSVTRQTLEAFGYRVLTAENGAEAVGVVAVERDQVAVVITDMMMPIMDGAAAAVAIRKINPRIRIIGASGLDTVASSRAASAGIVHFLAKPYSTGAVLTLLRVVLASEPA